MNIDEEQSAWNNGPNKPLDVLTKRAHELLHDSRVKGQTLADGISDLLNRGLDPNATVEGRPLVMDCLFPVQYDALAVLLKAGAQVNVCDNYGMSPLLLAVRFSNLDSYKLLLDHGADPIETVGDKEYPPLWAAVWQGREDVVWELMSRGAGRTSKDERYSFDELLKNAEKTAGADMRNLLLSWKTKWEMEDLKSETTEGKTRVRQKL